MKIVSRLDRVCLKKPTAPKLTDAQVAQRKVRAKPFSPLVSGGREQYILTLNEAWISLDFTNGLKVQFITQRKRSRKEHELHRLQLRLLDFVRKLCTPLVLHGEAKPACTSFFQILQSLVKFYQVCVGTNGHTGRATALWKRSKQGNSPYGQRFQSHVCCYVCLLRISWIQVHY